MNLTREEILNLGYGEARELPGSQVWIGTHRFMFTWGLVIGIDDVGYSKRYCYHSFGEALLAFHLYDGKSDPPGNWIVCKGERGGDRRNPNYREDILSALS